MPRGQTSYMLLSDFSTDYVASLVLVGAVKFCVRPPAGAPKWVLIASDAGEIRVFNESGVHQPGSDIDLGWNPDQVAINNEDPPKILIRRHSTLSIHLYESGVESWNVAGITYMIQALISDGWVHTLLSRTGYGANCGTEWRSLTDGAIDQGIRGISPISTCYAIALSVTESGEAVYYMWTSRTGSSPYYYPIYIRREDRSAGVAYNSLLTTQYNSKSGGVQETKTCADGSLVICVFYRVLAVRSQLFLRRGSDGAGLYTAYAGGNGIYRLSVNPAGTWAGYLYTDDLHLLTALGAHTTVVMGAAHAADYGCFDITDDPHFVCLLNNGDIEIYDDGLVLKATIAYDLTNSPIAVVRNT